MAINAANFLLALDELEATKGISKELILQTLKEVLEKGLRRASVLGIQSVVFGSGAARSFKDDYTLEKADEDMTRFLKEIVSPIASKYDVNIVNLLEKMSMIYCLQNWIL